MRPIKFIALSLALSSCAIVNPPGDDSQTFIRSEDSFGFCVGYCIRTLETEAGSWKLTAKGRDLDGELPAKVIYRDRDPQQWRYILDLANEIDFEKLQDVYGCPDCADGGAERIDYRRGVVSKEVVFEYRKPPTELQSLVDTLRGIRLDMFAELETDR